jgi:endonuclease/exonuclease/phosphatase family metal-dependent hydrolase
VAQRIRIELNGRTVHIANTHLHHRPTHDESIRLPQMQTLLHWMYAYSPTGWLLTGDMNALPTSATSAEAEKQLDSAYFTVHQQHPITFPTPLVTTASYPPVCIDYIFYDAQTFDVKSAQVFADQSHSEIETLYPSDHYGLLADFELR